MAIAYWIAAAFLTLGIIRTIINVGKPREAITGGQAALSSAIGAGVVFLLVVGAINS